MNRITVTLTAIALVLLLAACDGPAEDDIREAVLMIGHATGAVVMQSVTADSTPYQGVNYYPEERFLEFEGFSTERFVLASSYTHIDGTVRLGALEIDRAEVTLTGGPISEIEFGYDEVKPLAGMWTVSGRADGKRFRVEITMEQLRAFRDRG